MSTDKSNPSPSPFDSSNDIEYRKKLEKRQRKLEEPHKQYGNILDLKHAVSTTRKNRINASSRLLRTESFLQGINIYYSCFSAFLAVLSLVSERKELAIWSTVVAVILAISIVYLNAQKFGNRSQELKTNYIALHALLFEIEDAIAKNCEDRNNELTDKYCELLQTSENHTDLDFLRQKKNYGEKMSRAEVVKYYFLVGSHMILKFVAVISPLILLIRLVLLGVFSGLL